jgi:hypothetical protein
LNLKAGGGMTPHLANSLFATQRLCSGYLSIAICRRYWPVGFWNSWFAAANPDIIEGKAPLPPEGPQASLFGAGTFSRKKAYKI